MSLMIFSTPVIVKLFKFHPRLLVAVAVGLIAGFVLHVHFAALQCAVFGWDIGVWLYLVLIWILMVRANADQVRQSAEQEDESATMVLTLVTVASLASLAAIVLQLGDAKSLVGFDRLLHYGSTIATVLGSWMLVGSIFAIHYTRLFYTADDDDLPLKFPEDKTEPDYWDFLYFAFTIATAAQTSDVSIIKTAMRKVVLVQSILAFLFNAAILGLSINIAAGLIGN